EIEGVEADDVIGTLASRAERSGYQVYIVSSDKDFLQLVSDRVTVVHPSKDLRYGPRTVSERFGVPPDKVIDVLGLVGDAVDNVPGVPGIGEKGAVRLIREWGSLEAVLEHAGRLANRRQRQGLLEYREQARLSKRLVRISRDVPLEVELQDLRYTGPDREAALHFFEKLGFASLLKDFLPAADSRPAVSCRALESSSELRAVLEQARKVGRLSLSLLGPPKERLQGVGLAVTPGTAFYLSPGPQWREKELLRALGSVLSDRSLPKVGHDLKGSRLFLAELGVELNGIGFDTMIASYVLNPSKRSHDLDALALEVLHQPPSPQVSVPRQQGVLPGMKPPPAEGLLRQAAYRAEVALRLQECLEPRIEEEGLRAVFQDLELPLVEVLADMEGAGIGLDVDALRAMSEEIGAELARLTAEIYQLAGVEFNINSPKQLGEILFEKMNLPSFRKTEKQRAASTQKDVLEELALHFELPRKILEYRSLAKLKGTYIDSLPGLVHPETGRIHTSFNQTVAATGRLSSSEPNLQNIPIRTELGRRIRSAFVAQPGWLLLSADYSQIELRVLAHMSGDPSLIEAFRKGEDIHRRTALQVFGSETALSEAEQRRRAKIINFSIVYGKTAFTLSKEFGVPTREAQAFIDSYFERYPKVRELLDGIIRDATLTGKVKTLFGRHRYIPEMGSRNRTTREAAKRVAVNTPIQGTAADLIKKAMIDLSRELRRLGLKSRLLLQVHDELVLEVPEAEAEAASALVRQVMENVHPMAVPLEVDIAVGRSWQH
ncbi:MAG: DNA polymerase I, partial [Acidobacteriota bacterium]